MRIFYYAIGNYKISWPYISHF